MITRGLRSPRTACSPALHSQERKARVKEDSCCAMSQSELNKRKRRGVVCNLMQCCALGRMRRCCFQRAVRLRYLVAAG